MLENDTYEDYENATRGVEVHPITYRSRPVTGHREMIYVRNRRRWIEDASREISKLRHYNFTPMHQF